MHKHKVRLVASKKVFLPFAFGVKLMLKEEALPIDLKVFYCVWKVFCAIKKLSKKIGKSFH